MSVVHGPPLDSRALAIKVVTFLGGLYFFLYFLSPEWLLKSAGVIGAHESISNGFIAVGAMAIGLGIINIVLGHGSRIIFAKKGWFFSFTLLCGLCAMIGTSFAQWWFTQAVTAEIRRAQVVAEFASRIVADVNAEPGKERSFSPGGNLPPLHVRVSALREFGLTVVGAIRSDAGSFAEYVRTDGALQVLVSELTDASDQLELRLHDLSQHSWDTLTSDNTQVLQQLSSDASKCASTYSIVKRKVSAAGLVHRLYEFLFNGLFNQLGSAMFALLGVYIAAAAYRAFRIRSVESALMMGAALVVMLGQISFGRMVYEDMPAIRQWLLEVPNSAAFRAIRLGAGVAGLMLAIRMWLSIESAPGSRKGK
jgi:hypothetical protein